MANDRPNRPIRPRGPAGLDPSSLDCVLFNEYINWLARMGIINEHSPN